MTTPTPRLTPVTPVPEFLKRPTMDATTAALTDWIKELSGRVAALEIEIVRLKGPDFSARDSIAY